MKITPIFLLALCLFVFSCEKNNVKKLPDCIQELIDDRDYIDLIHCQRLNGELHYRINKGVIQADGVEYFINERCDTMCFISVVAYPECNSDYDNDKWKLIWYRE